MGDTRIGKLVQYGIVSHDDKEMLVTNGRISQFAVETPLDPFEIEWYRKNYQPGQSELLFSPRVDYFDTSMFQRIKDERPVGNALSASEVDDAGVAHGVQVVLGGGRCPRCRQYHYILLFSYSFSESNQHAHKQTLCLSCLETLLRRSETDVQS